MTPIQEICVLFPCHTLEDFPTHLRGEDAAGLLTSWTAPWHPRILATAQGIPAWYRADTPPVDLRGRILLIPSPSHPRLPKDLPQRIGDAENCYEISVKDRFQTTKEILRCLSLEEPPERISTDCIDSSSSSPASVAPFYALGSTLLQVQLMTRQLRYSSNLDLVTFSEHAVAAAKKWTEGDFSASRTSLQAAFDLLGEERDHYFSGDPHLIDLVLVASSTIGPELLQTLEGSHPLNLLMASDVAQEIARSRPDIAARIAARVAEKTLSVVGGTPSDQWRMEHLGSQEVAPALQQARQETLQAVGALPVVFARLGGGIPGDLPPWLLGAGFTGAITNDFTSGVGSQNESKLLWQAGGAEIEALTAAPKETLEPQTFLGLGPQLGQAADGGQVAAALLVRWPGEASPFLDDLRESTSFSPALGRFWTLDDFFSKGERPYHCCSLPSASTDGQALVAAVESKLDNPLSTVAQRFQHAKLRAAADVSVALARLLYPSENANSAPAVPSTAISADPHAHFRHATQELIEKLGFTVAQAAQSTAAGIVLQPHVGALRTEATLQGPPPDPNTPGLYAAHRLHGLSQVTVDVPGIGFAAIVAGTKETADSSKQKGGLLGWLHRPKAIASSQSLANEFMDVAIHPEHGGIAAVHCGKQRGNRFSWQLALYDSKLASYSSMIAQRIEVLQSDVGIGVLQVSGTLSSPQGPEPCAEYSLQYTLRRGSRWLEITITLNPLTPLRPTPWEHYFSGRAAWATNALAVRPLVRDKLHQGRGKKLEAPLGILVDEGDRTLQICSFGLPAHRRVDLQHLDTLLLVAGENERTFRLAYGFDVPAPVRAAHHHLVPPVVWPLESPPPSASRQWLVDIDSPHVILTEFRAAGDGKWIATVVESSGKPLRARLRFFQDIQGATRLPERERLAIEEGAIILRLAGHEIIHIEIVPTSFCSTLRSSPLPERSADSDRD